MLHASHDAFKNHFGPAKKLKLKKKLKGFTVILLAMYAGSYDALRLQMPQIIIHL